MNLKVNDNVWQIERSKLIPGGFYKWKGIVTEITNVYIEVKWNREPVDWLEDLRNEMKKGSGNNIDRTYFEQWTKNYFSSEGLINIEKINETTLA